MIRVRGSMETLQALMGPGPSPRPGEGRPSEVSASEAGTASSRPLQGHEAQNVC